ncbi:hypothetical protein F4808DRAFT_452809 [Astrocystis sublimbata]|nr:hypothetical protein F4808DRAFT_452809 [Astrocystis sublimbata]
MAWFRLFSSLYFILSFISCINAATTGRTNTCYELVKVFGDKVSLPRSAEYVTVAPENWSETAQLSPNCVFEPESAQDVADGVRILVKHKTKFAIRGGGHMPVRGAANIDNGVLMSLNKFTMMKMTKQNTVAQLGPGLRWHEVYNWTSTYGLAVSGGRYAPVGVPGYLLGGGISFFGSRYGWSTNMVVNYEVVLANSSILNANAKENTDLFWALKGGSNNYGIVTRFDVKTFPLGEVYGGLSIFEPQYLNDFVNAAAYFSTLGGGSDDLNASYNPSVQIEAKTGKITLLSWCAYQDANTNPAAFANFTRIPTLFSNNAVMPNLAQLSTTTDTEAFSARNGRQVFRATGLKADPASVLLANATLFKIYNAMPELKKLKGLVITSTPQMISRSWLEVARASGGDPMDIEPGNGLIFHLIGAAWEEAKDDQLVYKFTNRFIAELDKASKARKLDRQFIYINDAGPGQKPFGLYGNGRSIKRMRAIRDRYDPHHYFQTLVSGGFKLG